MIIKKLSYLLKNILIWDHEERKHCSVSTGTPLQVILKVLKVNTCKYTILSNIFVKNLLFTSMHVWYQKIN